MNHRADGHASAHVDVDKTRPDDDDKSRDPLGHRLQTHTHATLSLSVFDTRERDEQCACVATRDSVWTGH